MSFLQRNVQNRDGAIGLVAFVSVKHLVVVHLVDVVTRQQNDVIGIESVDKVYILINGVCGALVPLAGFRPHVRRQNEYAAVKPVQIPRLSVADVLMQLERAILRQHADGVDVAVDAV